MFLQMACLFQSPECSDTLYSACYNVPCSLRVCSTCFKDKRPELRERGWYVCSGCDQMLCSDHLYMVLQYGYIYCERCYDISGKPIMIRHHYDWTYNMVFTLMLMRNRGETVWAGLPKALIYIIMDEVMRESCRFGLEHLTRLNGKRRRINLN